MKLTDLEPQFCPYERRDGHVFHVNVDLIEDAQGVRFLCPACFAKNGGRAGTHAIICWSESRGTPADAKPGPGRWKMSGTGYGDLTLTGDNGCSNSVDAGCWHGFVTGGAIT